jgi:hypothetical protein
MDRSVGAYQLACSKYGAVLVVLFTCSCGGSERSRTAAPADGGGQVDWGASDDLQDASLLSDLTTMDQLPVGADIGPTIGRDTAFGADGSTTDLVGDAGLDLRENGGTGGIRGTGGSGGAAGDGGGGGVDGRVFDMGGSNPDGRTADSPAERPSTSQDAGTTVKIVSFTADPAAIETGDSSTLRYSVQGAAELSIDQAIGNVTDRTSVTVSPTATTTYTLTALDSQGGSVTAQATVTVLGPGSFLPSGVESLGTSEQTATLLRNGQVLIAGGRGQNGCYSVAELYDPVTATFSWSSDTVMNQERCGHAASLLGDDTSESLVLITGGIGGFQNAELYAPGHGYPDPDKAFVVSGQMVMTRRWHTSTLLPNGQVLLAGGNRPPTDEIPYPYTYSECETFDGGKFTATGSMKYPRDHHRATLLMDGKVLVTGGSNSVASLSQAELYDSAAGTFAETGSMAAARADHTETLLPDGRVLITGGYDNVRNPPLATAELYDPATRTFATTSGPMTSGRKGHTATLLGNGKVLIAGGQGASDYQSSPDLYLSSAELYDPSTGTFTPTGSLSKPRAGHTATHLADSNRVLIVGGRNLDENGIHEVETYLY